MPKPLYRFKSIRMIGLRSRPVNFKEVFNVRILQFHINPFITVSQLIDNLRPELAVQFNINENDIEIVESGQYILGCLAEEAPELVPSNRKLCHIWGENLENLAFYVRRKNHIYPQIENARRQREANQNINTSNPAPQNGFIDDCPICLESSLLTRRYNCSHGICSQCYQNCLSASISVCSLCRSTA